MGKKTKFFRVAVEGPTVDGREISREWLTQIAANYDPQMYGARMNIEHIRGVAPMSATNPFGSYGDVIAVAARTLEEGPLKGRMALFAQIEPTDDLVALTKKRQKLYTSIEVNPSFADTDEAYLIAIAATDRPASLGVEAMQFAARRSSNLFSEACETSIEIDGVADTQNLLSVVKGLFSRQRATEDQRYTDTRDAIEEIARHASEQEAHISTLRTEMSTAQETATTAQLTADKAIEALNTLTEKLAAADAGTARRQKSTGSTGELVTDC